MEIINMDTINHVKKREKHVVYYMQTMLTFFLFKKNDIFYSWKGKIYDSIPEEHDFNRRACKQKSENYTNNNSRCNKKLKKTGYLGTNNLVLQVHMRDESS